MPKADCVFSTPQLVATISAPGASSLCPASLIPDSRPGASLALASDGEPYATPQTCSSGAGGSMTRRTIMNSLVALPIANALPVTSPAMSSSTSADTVHPDAILFELEEKIFKYKEAFDALQPDVDRLSNIWCRENHRLADQFEKTRISPNFDERKAIVDAMPEFEEYMRLRGLQEHDREVADDLVNQMWQIKAQTPEGRRSKLVVLLGYVMESDEWRTVYDEDCHPFDITRARDLMIEFVGGKPAAQLRDQFA